MNKLDTKYNNLLDFARSNDEILGVVLGGSRSKGIKFVTEKSDYDVYVVYSEDASEVTKQEIDSFISNDFEVFAMSLKGFDEYGISGSETHWERYNFAHNKPVIDKTGEIEELLKEKSQIPLDQRKDFIEMSLDAYVNQVYRSAKNFRDGNKIGGHLDALESLPFLMDALYALEGRVKPYNKYFEWELKNYPLAHLFGSTDEFVADYLEIAKTGDIDTQGKIFSEMKKLFEESGYSNITKGWNGYYFVG